MSMETEELKKLREDIKKGFESSTKSSLDAVEASRVLAEKTAEEAKKSRDQIQRNRDEDAYSSAKTKYKDASTKLESGESEKLSDRIENIQKGLGLLGQGIGGLASLHPKSQKGMKPVAMVSQFAMGLTVTALSGVFKSNARNTNLRAAATQLHESESDMRTYGEKLGQPAPATAGNHGNTPVTP